MEYGILQKKKKYVSILNVTDEKIRIRIRNHTVCHGSGTLEISYIFSIFVDKFYLLDPVPNLNADPDPATQINADPDPATQIKVDQDPKPCFISRSFVSERQPNFVMIFQQ